MLQRRQDGLTRPTGITVISLFFVFGTAMSAITLFLLVFPDSRLEPLWRLNRDAREGFAAMDGWAIVLMVVVAAACATAAVGLWRCKEWGFRTALAVLSINVVADVTNAVFGRDWRTLIGLPVGAAMILYLVSRRRVFRHLT